MEQLDQSLFDLVAQTASNLPEDVREAIRAASKKETLGTQAAQALDIILKNVDRAYDNVLPICQDTGMPTFHVHCPVGMNQITFRGAIERAMVATTKAGKLRPNSVNSVTNRNSGDNIGAGTPVVHFHQWERDDVEVVLLLKGGGCENKNIQYSLPTELPKLGRADRNLEGVYKCILHAVWQAQGQGCSQGFIGVCIGGDRTTGYSNAKDQLFRHLGDTNPLPELAELEERVMANADTLGIGPMGFGGASTLLGCKIGAVNRLPASFFVSVAYNCWAYRRLGVVLDPTTGAIRNWLFRAESPARMAETAGFQTTGKEVRLTTPITEEQVRSLKVGDVVLLNGLIYTGRDEIHKYLMKHDPPVDLNGAVLYHCGPVALKDEAGEWHIKAAGPTTSSREEPYTADVLQKFGVRVVMGKGGMGGKTLAALQENGAVYLNAIGGAAQFYSDCIKKVEDVHLLEEFGIPEAMWEMQVVDFPAIVTMDSHGDSLHKLVEESSLERLGELAPA